MGRRYLKPAVRKRVERHSLNIPVSIYRMTVAVFWEINLADALLYCKERGCSLSIKEAKEIVSFADGAAGLASNIGAKNTDVLVWLRERPRRASSYGTLYHELYHAVDYISASHKLSDEREARAYLFEYLATQCNRFFWGKK